MRAVPEIETELERRVEGLGFELVEIRWGGSGRRPMLKLRVDRQDTVPGEGVTVDDCAVVGCSTWASCYNVALLGLFFRGVRNDDSSGRLR